MHDIPIDTICFILFKLLLLHTQYSLFPIFLNTILISFRFLFIFFSIIIAQTTVLHNRHFDTKRRNRTCTLCDSAKLFSLIFKPQNHENRVKCQSILFKIMIKRHVFHFLMAYFAYIVSFVYKFLFSYYAYFSFPNLEKASPTDSSVLIRHFLGVAMHTRVNNGLS